MIDGNYDDLANELLDSCYYDTLPDATVLSEELKKVLAPQMGLSIQEMDTPALLQGLVKVLIRFGIRMPSRVEFSVQTNIYS